MSSAHETKSLGPGINELALLGLADPMGCSVEAEKSLINLIWMDLIPARVNGITTTFGG
jgi:hypothetical protein